MLDSKYVKRLKAQQSAGLYRNPPEIDRRDGRFLWLDGKKMLNFASNDYLGFGSSCEIRKHVAENFMKYGSSSSSSRLVTGNYTAIRDAEKAYAAYFGYEDAIFFPSGYQANLGTISTLFDKDDAIIFDKHVHASTVKGISHSGAPFSGYRHNSYGHLEKKLASTASGSKVVITEALFSMDGDFPDFLRLTDLKSEYGFICLVDEAHSYGALGDKGRGLSAGVADIGVGTFGKAFGLFGAFVLLPSVLRDYLVNFASPYIYTTSLPEAHGVSALQILDRIERADKERDALKHISVEMKTRLKSAGFKVAGDAHILSVEIGDEDQAVSLTEQLRKKHIFAFPARFPTVPMNKAIIRISLTSMHTSEDVSDFCTALQSLSG